MILKAAIKHAPYGKRIKSAIGYRCREQGEVADKIGISRNAMSKIVRGETTNPSFSVVRAIAAELDVSMDYLAGLSDEIERRK